MFVNLLCSSLIVNYQKAITLHILEPLRLSIGYSDPEEFSNNEGKIYAHTYIYTYSEQQLYREDIVVSGMFSSVEQDFAILLIQT